MESATKGTRAYLSKALGGRMVGMQRLSAERVRVWFFHVPIGEYRPGEDGTVQPLADSSVRAEPIPGAR